MLQKVSAPSIEGTAETAPKDWMSGKDPSVPQTIQSRAGQNFHSSNPIPVPKINDEMFVLTK